MISNFDGAEGSLRRGSRTIVASIVVLANLFLNISCGPTSGTQGTAQSAFRSVAQNGTDRPNVILVVADALRADHLGVYGYERRSVSPNIDAIAARSQVYLRAISPAGWTVPSMASLFSGEYPQTHQVLRFIDPSEHGVFRDRIEVKIKMDALSPQFDTVAECFQRGGYNTVALLKSHVVNAGRGFEQGFDRFEIILKGPKADGTSGKHLADSALDYLVARQSQAEPPPFFLYLHFMDTHIPYRPPEPYFSKYLDDSWETDQDGSYRQYQKFLAREETRAPQASPTADDIEMLTALYDGSIEFFDAQVGRIWDFLEDSGLTDNTIFVLTADHGEAFHEHGMVGHSGVFQEHIHVPLLLWVPGLAQATLDSWVETIQVPPTLLRLSGLREQCAWRKEALMLGEVFEETSPTAVFSEWGREHAIIDQRGFKLIVTPEHELLFDLNSDPGEREDLLDDNPAIADNLRDLLREHITSTKEAASLFPKIDRAELDDEQVEALRELGYIQ